MLHERMALEGSGERWHPSRRQAVPESATDRHAPLAPF